MCYKFALCLGNSRFCFCSFSPLLWQHSSGMATGWGTFALCLFHVVDVSWARRCDIFMTSCLSSSISFSPAFSQVVASSTENCSKWERRKPGSMTKEATLSPPPRVCCGDDNKVVQRAAHVINSSFSPTHSPSNSLKPQSCFLFLVHMTLCVSSCVFVKASLWARNVPSVWNHITHRNAHRAPYLFDMWTATSCRAKIPLSFPKDVSGGVGCGGCGGVVTTWRKNCFCLGALARRLHTLCDTVSLCRQLPSNLSPPS